MLSSQLVDGAGVTESLLAADGPGVTPDTGEGPGEDDGSALTLGATPTPDGRCAKCPFTSRSKPTNSTPKYPPTRSTKP